MAELELQFGVFIAINLIALISLMVAMKYAQLRPLFLISTIAFGALTLYMLDGYDIVQVKKIPALNATSTSVQRDVDGDIVSTVEKSASVPSHEETDPIIDSNQEIFGWLYFVGAFITLIFFIVAMLDVVNHRQLEVSS